MIFINSSSSCRYLSTMLRGADHEMSAPCLVTAPLRH